MTMRIASSYKHKKEKMRTTKMNIMTPRGLLVVEGKREEK
jgi:hypothetical protein